MLTMTEHCGDMVRRDLLDLGVSMQTAGREIVRFSFKV